MTAPISQNSANAQQMPIAASNLGGSRKFEPGSFVVNPPQNVYKYSVYDELDLGKDRFKEILNEIQSKKPSKELQKSKRKSVLKKILNLTILAGICIIGYKYRTNIKTAAENIYNRVKNLFIKKS